MKRDQFFLQTVHLFAQITLTAANFPGRAVKQGDGVINRQTFFNINHGRRFVHYINRLVRQTPAFDIFV